jgi:hypothetical protein
MATEDRDNVVDADGYIDFAKLASEWVDGTDPANFTPEELDRIKDAPDQAAQIEAELARKTKDLPIDVRALGY